MKKIDVNLLVIHPAIMGYRMKLMTFLSQTFHTSFLVMKETVYSRNLGAAKAGINFFNWRETLQFRAFKEYFNLFKQVRKNNVILCSFSRSLPTLFLVATKFLHRKKIIVWEEWLPTGKASLKTKIFNFLGRKATKYIDGFFTLGPLQREMLISFDVPPEHIFTANEYPEVIYSEIPEKGVQLPCPEGKYVLSIGRVIPLKGLEYVIDAFGDKRILQKDLHLLIVGDSLEPDYMQSLKTRAKQASPEKIHFMPAVFENERKSFLFKHCLCCIIASCRDNAGTRDAGPLVTLEALSAGAPLIMTDIIGNAWHIKEGLNGYVVPERNVEKIVHALCLLDDGKIGMQEEIIEDFHSIPGFEFQCKMMNNLVELAAHRE